MNAEVKTLLLVDDEPANIQIVNSILKDNYQTLIATNGVKALELANQDPPPDLILLDVKMPEMDGYEVCARLKSADHTRDIPVIFLTGQTEIDNETKGFEVGAVDYIHKPFSPAVVQARVRTHLKLRGISEQLEMQLQTIQSEMDTARQIQLSILPREIPAIKGLDIAARYIPMASVAGDFYDFIRIDEHRIGILVADVSGHGMPAALISSMLKIALDGQTGCALEPARVLAGLNRALCGKFQGHFVTTVYVVVDTERQSLLYAGAGHPPLVIMDRSAGGGPRLRRERFVPWYLPRSDIHFDGDLFQNGRLGCALHRRCPGDDRPIRKAIWVGSPQAVSPGESELIGRTVRRCTS
jgi:CheY-like chemotaxis protein